MRIVFALQVPGGVGSLFGKHHKNCECCPMSLTMNVEIVVLNCSQCSLNGIVFVFVVRVCLLITLSVTCLNGDKSLRVLYGSVKY